jgi:hypothetical protein
MAFSTRPIATFSTEAVSSAPPVNFTRRRTSIRKQQGDFVLKEHSTDNKNEL